jgi:hypothetical protein
MAGPTTPHGKPHGLGWSLFARRYSGSRFFFPFLRLLRCFSSPRSFGNLGINARLTASPRISQSSTPVRLTPRHPPRALISLTTMISNSPRRDRNLREPTCAVAPHEAHAHLGPCPTSCTDRFRDPSSLTHAEHCRTPQEGTTPPDNETGNATYRCRIAKDRVRGPSRDSRFSQPVG